MSKNICLTMTEQQAQIIYKLLRVASSLGNGSLREIWGLMPIQFYPYASNYLEERIHNSNLKTIVDLEKKAKGLRLGNDLEFEDKHSCIRDMCRDFGDFFVMTDPNGSPESKADILAASASIPRGSSPKLIVRDD